MAVQSAGGNAALAKLAGNYKAKEEEETDPLGRDAFLTMLVAQLQHQDPLNPMDGTDFTAQLAQFSQLEAQFNTNEKLDQMVSSMEEGSSKDLEAYMGKEILAEVDAIEVSGGKAIGGFYTLEEPATINVNIYDNKGQKIRSMVVGYKKEGSYAVEWDGKDAANEKVGDGSYKYEVIAITDKGLSKVQTTVQGAVDGILYSNGKPYLQVNNTFVNPDSLLKIWEPADPGPVISPVDYIGHEVTADSAAIDFNKSFQSKRPGYKLDRNNEVKVEIYDAAGNLVKEVSEGMKSGGTFHEISWNGTDAKGKAVPPGVYHYRVLTKGAFADTSVTGEVSGLIYKNGKPYLNVDGNLVPSGSIRSVQQQES